jgi:hypothetical protein
MGRTIHFGKPTLSCGRSERVEAFAEMHGLVHYSHKGSLWPRLGHPFKFLVLFHSPKRTTTAAAGLVTKTLYASALIAACSRSHVP